MTATDDRSVEESHRLGQGCRILRPCVVGLVWKPGVAPLRVGQRAVVRTFTVVYAGVSIGDDFQSGHGAVIRQGCHIGNRVVVGSNSVVENDVTIGDDVKIESGVCIASHSVIGNRVFIGPGAATTNDRYPQRRRGQYRPMGPRIEDDVTIGANAVILPGVTIGRGSLIAAGSLVSRDVAPWSLVKGVPGRSAQLPDSLREENRACTRDNLQGE